MAAVKQLLVKKPFVRIRPESATNTPFREVSQRLTLAPVNDDQSWYNVYSQADFMREYYPTGHKIYDKTYYPDRYKKDPDTGRIIKEEVVRYAFSFQQLIALKHTVTLCGNDIQFTQSEINPKEAESNTFYDFQMGWQTHDMEIAWYEAARSAKITGDAALVGYMHEGKFRWKVLSFLNGDTLYPHYDSITGHLTMFARRYNDTDENDNILCHWVELWDSTYIYRFKESTTGVSGALNKIKEIFGIDGYSLVSQEPHNFTFVPVAYIRTDGPCWMFSQDSIEQYELAFSYMSQNNQAFAFPIMYMKGDEIEVQGDPMTDSVKVISMDNDSDAGFLNPPDGSDFFKMQLTTLYNMILEQSSIPKIPEPKSGDLPGVAVKLMFYQSIERSIEDAQLYKRFINGMVRIFKYGFGVESGKFSSFENLKVSFYIEPYIPMNNSELINNLATAVQNGFLSKQTASEKISMYATAQEIDRLIREHKQEQEQDVIAQLTNKKNEEGNSKNNAE
jgi:hypothetical protein